MPHLFFSFCPVIPGGYLLCITKKKLKENKIQLGCFMRGNTLGVGHAGNKYLLRQSYGVLISRTPFFEVLPYT
jgi:hypothetical protein